MNTKMLREDIRTGQVDYILIEQSPNDGTFVWVHMRKTHNRFLLDRSFPTAVSALKMIERMIQLKPIAGLNEEYSREPDIKIRIRRKKNETNQHDQKAE